MFRRRLSAQRSENVRGKNKMPIDYNTYPPNWKTEIRPRILKKYGNRCAFCGVKNYDKNPLTGSKVVLTIMHLDHDPENENITDDRLRAACQRCHLNYDRIERQEKKRIKQELNQPFLEF